MPMDDMKAALRAVLAETGVATRADLQELSTRVQAVEQRVEQLPSLVEEEVRRQLAAQASDSTSTATGSTRSGRSSTTIFVLGTVHVRGWAKYGDPATGIPEDEAQAIDVELRKALSSEANSALRLAAPGVANHQLLYRINFRESDPRMALQEARRYRDALAEASAAIRVRGHPLRVSLELPPERKMRLHSFFRQVDALRDHCLDEQVDTNWYRVCPQSLRVHRVPSLVVLGSFDASGRWEWKEAAFHEAGVKMPPLVAED